MLRLHYFDGFTAAEIACKLDTTARYAEKLIWKALSKVRVLYGRLHQMQFGEPPLAVTIDLPTDAALCAPAIAMSRESVTTRLQRMMQTHDISNAALIAESGVPDEHLAALLNGHRVDRGSQARLLGAIRRITSSRRAAREQPHQGEPGR